MKKSTIFDVAELAGVSINSVSRVINGHPDVGAATRLRVDQAIAELDYQPYVATRQPGDCRTRRSA